MLDSSPLLFRVRFDLAEQSLFIFVVLIQIFDHNRILLGLVAVLVFG